MMPTRPARLTSGVIMGLSMLTACVLAVLAASPAMAQAAGPGSNPEAARWAYLGAALSAGLAALGAGYAVAKVGSSAIGAVAEKPELFGRVLVLVGLAEGIAIYGLIVSILILNRVG